MRLRAIRKPENEVLERLMLEAERRKRDAREAEKRRAFEQEIKAAQAADRRAYQFLIDHLDEHQRASLALHRSFELVSQRGRVYRIMQGDSMNVVRLRRDGSRYGRYCGLPNDVPIFDTMLAQLILLKCDEDYFLSRANFVPA